MTLPAIEVAGVTLQPVTIGLWPSCSRCRRSVATIHHSLGTWSATECTGHLNPAVAATIGEIRLQIEAARSGAVDAEPACWAWPPPPSADGEPYAALERWHEGRCAICGHHDALVDDHDHDTDLIRGLLCQGCNLTEGRSGMPIIRRYRERPPSAILGLQVPYAHPFGRGPRAVA